MSVLASTPPTLETPVLELRHVTRAFTQGDSTLSILEGCSLALHTGMCLALVAPSGAGKSTLLQIAGLLERPNSGEVWVEGRQTTHASDETRTLLRRETLGFVYQYHHLLPEFSALENVMLPLLIAGKPERIAQGRARDLLASVGLAARLTHRPSALSGGEQQRVAIARALANAPRVLIADEPTGNLDPHTAETVLEVLMTRVRQDKLAMLMATHNGEIARQMDGCVTLRNGKVV